MAAHLSPNAAQLAATAEAIGRAGRQVEQISLHNYSNDAHPSWHALALAWRSLLLAEALCLAGGPMPGQMESVRVEMQNLERVMAELRR